MKSNLLILIFVMSLKLYSQESNKAVSDTLNLDTESVYFEFMGNTFSTYSINYEFIFYSNKVDDDSNKVSLSLRIGTGTGFIENQGALSMINYVIGKEYNLEMGAGILYTFRKADDTWGEGFKMGHTEHNLLFTITIGYKYISFSDDWLFKIGFTPIISYEGIILPAIGISYGSTF